MLGPWPRLTCLVNDEAFTTPEHGWKGARGPRANISVEFCTFIPTPLGMAGGIGKATEVAPGAEAVPSSAGKAVGQLSGTRQRSLNDWNSNS